MSHAPLPSRRCRPGLRRARFSALPRASTAPSDTGGVPTMATAAAMAAMGAMAALLLPQAAAGQSIEEQLRQLGADNGRLYAHPVASGLGTALNSGWYHSARSLGPFHVEFSVRGMAAVVPAEDETYQPILPEEVTVEELGGQTFQNPYGTGEGIELPTAVGEGPATRIQPQGELRDAILASGQDPDDFALPFPRGFDIPAVPMAVLQLNVGVLPGVEVSGRLLPSLEISDDVGSVQSVGGGVKLTVTEWTSGSFPLDVAVAGSLQSFDAGDYLDASSRQVSLVASRDLAVLTLYASGSLEASDAEVEYTVENPNLPEGGTTISFEDEGDNSSRLTAGFSLNLLFLQLSADYSVSDYDVATAGLGVRF